MARKKTTYEKKGFMRQIAGSIFSPAKEKTQEGKWRPRKKQQFEKLLGDDDETESLDIINRAFSVESETCDYRRESSFHKKKEAMANTMNRKRDLTTIAIKPSSRDQANNRGGKIISKRRKTSIEKPEQNPKDPVLSRGFHFEPFGKSDDSVDESLSRHTYRSKASSTTDHTAFNTVNSDPSEFFPKNTARLTRTNLERMAAMSAQLSSAVSSDSIENVNPRNMFHQFTPDEDKESTVILPVLYPDQDSQFDQQEEAESLEENSLMSLGFTSKGTQIQKKDQARQTMKPFSPFSASKVASPNPEKSSFFFDLRTDIATEAQSCERPESAESVRRFDPVGAESLRKELPQRLNSTQSLVYSETSNEPTFPYGPMGFDRTPLSPLNAPRNTRSSHKKAKPFDVDKTSREGNKLQPEWSCFESDHGDENRPVDGFDSFVDTSPDNLMETGFPQSAPSFNAPAPKAWKTTAKVDAFGGFAVDFHSNQARAARSQIDVPPQFKAVKNEPAKGTMMKKHNWGTTSGRQSIQLTEELQQSTGGTFDSAWSPNFPAGQASAKKSAASIESLETKTKAKGSFEATSNSTESWFDTVDDLKATIPDFHTTKKDMFGSVVEPTSLGTGDGLGRGFKEFQAIDGRSDAWEERSAPAFSKQLQEPEKASNDTSTLFREAFGTASGMFGVEAQSMSSGTDRYRNNANDKKNTAARESKENSWKMESNALYSCNRSIPEDFAMEEDADIQSHLEEPREAADRPMGIRSFPAAVKERHSHSSTASSLLSNHLQMTSARSLQSGSILERSIESRSMDFPKPHRVPDLEELGAHDEETASTTSYNKPMGLPNNAIMASMLFRRHHNVDTRAVEAKIKAKEEEYTPEGHRGDIPRAVHAFDDNYSVVSSFSEDTTRLDMWKKPTKDLLEHFSRARQTESDFKRQLNERRANATALYEA
eukprot:Nitzschia sp. Nitz4//scaffold117_size69655//28549//31365//NITZ4_006024-RA/size69655-processed-gene-0.40-mRNA-1//-1//CDS//3329533651//6762//frame0